MLESCPQRSPKRTDNLISAYNGTHLAPSVVFDFFPYITCDERSCALCLRSAEELGHCAKGALVSAKYVYS